MRASRRQPWGKGAAAERPRAYLSGDLASLNLSLACEGHQRVGATAQCIGGPDVPVLGDVDGRCPRADSLVPDMGMAR